MMTPSPLLTAPSPESHVVLDLPQTLYAKAGDSASGIVGWLSRDGVVHRYTPQICPRPVVYWDDTLKRKVTGTCVWDGVHTGTLIVGRGGVPHRRPVDVNTFDGFR